MEKHEPINQEQLMESALVPPGTAEEIRKLCPEALAAWQAGFKDSRAKHILAEKEWERRNTKELAYWQRMAAWIGVAGAVVGSLITILGATLLGS